MLNKYKLLREFFFSFIEDIEENDMSNIIPDGTITTSYILNNILPQIKKENPKLYDLFWVELTKETNLKYTDFFKEDVVIEKKVIVSKFTPKIFADMILKQYSFVKDKYKRFWRYDIDEGIWKEDTEEWLAKYIRENLLEDTTSHHINEIIKYIEHISYDPNETMDQNPFMIALKNGVFNLKTFKLEEDPESFKLTTKLNINYNEDAKGVEIIDKFFTDLVGEEKKSILYDLCAYSLFRGYPYQKYFFLYGSGANGKSTFLNFLHIFLGKDNISSETPHNLLNNKFAASSLFGKLVNISSDISYELMKNTNILKMLVGGDEIMCERKFKDPFPFVNYAKLIFSANQLPMTDDNTFAFYRRLYLIKFENEFIGEKKDSNILEKITEREVMESFLLVCLKRLKKMMERGWVFEIDPDVEDIRIEYDRLSNPLREFIDRKCEFDITGWVGEQTFYKKYNEWALKKKRNIFNTKEIRKMLNNMGVLRDRKFSDGKRYYAFIGIRWKEEKQTNSIDALKEFIEQNDKGDGVLYIDLINNGFSEEVIIKAKFRGDIYESKNGIYKVL